LAILIERMITLEARWPTLELAPFYQAALVFGLSLTNHHFIALMTAPAFIPTLSRVARARGWKPVAFAAALTFVGLLTYVYLPVRAGTAPPIDLGHPADASSFFWVVSARAYQHTNTIQAQPLFDRMLDVVLALDESLHIVTLRRLGATSCSRYTKGRMDLDLGRARLCACPRLARLCSGQP
jgi:hypothetical protein